MARILVIDDEPLVRAAVRRLLEFAGHEVREAVDGVEGADLFRRQPCDLVLCDIFMPQESGLATIRKLCAGSPGAKVVAVSGGGFDRESDILPDALRAGAAAALRKPFRVEALLGLVGEILAMSLPQEP
jgi:CheY-like chemotaxis protein